MLLVCPHPNLAAAAPVAAPVVVPPQEENPLEVALAAERAVAAQVVKVVEVPVARVAALVEKEDLVVAKAAPVVEVLAVVARQELVVKAVEAQVARAAALEAKAMQTWIARKLEKTTLHRSKVSSKR